MTSAPGEGEQRGQLLPAGRPLTVRWVVLDAVGTVIFANPAVGDVYHRVASRHGSRRTRQQIADRFHRVLREDDRADLLQQTAGRWRCRPTSEEREWDRWQAVVGRVIDDVPGDAGHACFEELFGYFGRSDAWTCFEDVEPCLADLASRAVPVAVASNFDRRLDTICAELKPLRGIDPVLVSSRLGFRKPDERFFQQVTSALDCRPEDILFVGDDLRNDIEAARAAGMHAVHINRTARQLGTGSIASLTEIVERVEVHP